MRLIVCSDSHGRWDLLKKLLEQERDYEYIIFLGDGAADVKRVLRDEASRTILVRGNCDLASAAPENRILTAAGRRILCTHGYREQVKWGRQVLLERAKAQRCDLAFFGHTHVPFAGRQDGVYLFNPGALAEGVYGVADLTPDGELCFHKTIRS